MSPNDIARVQAYLRKMFDNNRIRIIPPAKQNGPVEVNIGEEFVGVLHRDDDEGEISFDFHLTILEEDLPTAAGQPGSRPSR